ncbi:hypothetical protein [Austwickia chelonae]|nr:hypothetical protein [Austwickia chelonae]
MTVSPAIFEAHVSRVVASWRGGAAGDYTIKLRRVEIGELTINREVV